LCRGFVVVNQNRQPEGTVMKRPHPTMLLFAMATTAYLASFSSKLEGDGGPAEAPAAFDNRTNGFISQADFDAALAQFEERQVIDDGLGPVYNAQSCAECHQTPVTGATSQVSELRAGHKNIFGKFVDAPGGSLINDRAIAASIQEYVPDAETIRTFRMSTNTLGDGFIEAVDSAALIRIATEQPFQSGGLIAGQAIYVPVLESLTGATSVGRFGWKDQHSSLLSFAADAYLNEMGITNRFFPAENTSLGRSVAAFDAVPDPEDAVKNDIDEFADFMRATKAPPRDTALALTSAAIAGSLLFNQTGCNICHVRSITTAPIGMITDAGFVVPPALGNKIIHPFSDLLLHDIGTGDGIVQNGGQSTANKLRTAPLWGLRTRSRHMHDGATLTLLEAIRRHGGEAAGVTAAFRRLTVSQRSQIIAFLNSL
jgi:CxxC motif-containing protein (DUF1111 family)